VGETEGRLVLTLMLVLPAVGAGGARLTVTSVVGPSVALSSVGLLLEMVGQMEGRLVLMLMPSSVGAGGARLTVASLVGPIVALSSVSLLLEITLEGLDGKLLEASL